MSEAPSVSSVVLSLNRALLGAVSNSLRAVHFQADEKKIDIFFFFDGVISVDDEDTMGTVGAEVAADFPALSVYEHGLRVDSPARLKGEPGRHVVFARKE